MVYQYYVILHLSRYIILLLTLLQLPYCVISITKYDNNRYKMVTVITECTCSVTFTCMLVITVWYIVTYLLYICYIYVLYMIQSLHSLYIVTFILFGIICKCNMDSKWSEASKYGLKKILPKVWHRRIMPKGWHK